ncbi:MAG TPA: hypothetical protein VK858_19830 [Longimicrobiales bacterium]|nr:hypothetical protein [Longimicrobiales bacterium]
MMRRVFTAAALALMVAAPLSAQDWQVRVDRSTNAADPDDVPEVEVMEMGGGLHVVTGPAAVVWSPDDRAQGEYELSGTFVLQSPSDHNNYYGLVFGGGDLASSSQNYLYFLVSQNGMFLIKHRANDEAVHTLVEGTEHAAINRPEGGTSSNDLSVRVGESSIEFLVNGTVVHTLPREGMASRTDGIYGVRVNHRIPGVMVTGLEVTSGM